MSPDEIVKDIIVAMIEKGSLSTVATVCDAYSKIYEIVNYPQGR